MSEPVSLIGFSSGALSGAAKCAEWNGTNEADVLAWVRDNDPYNDAIDESQRWLIAATSPNLVLQRPATHPRGWGATVTVKPNHWVTIMDLTTGHIDLYALDPGGRWKTTDPYGRPNNLDDLLSP